MAQPQLSSGQEAAPDRRDRIIESLEEENSDLKEQLRQAQNELAARNSTPSGVAELRSLLLPIHNGLKLIFGEIDRIMPEGSAAAAPVNDKKRAIWQSWMKKLGGLQAEFIGALLEHDQMTAAQLRVALKCGRDTVYGLASKLGKLGLVEQHGGQYSLKEL